MPSKYLEIDQLQKQLFKRTEGYADNVRSIYFRYIDQLINLVNGTELIDGKYFSFDEYGYGDEATRILRKLYASVYKVIRRGSESEWLLSESNNDKLVKSIFGSKSISDHHFSRFFLRNKEAMDAFLNRKVGNDGLDLSKKVWKYVDQLKTELEDSLDLSIGEGTPANQLATTIKKYLNEPDRFYRRFRVRTGTDEDGKPIYDSIWKRRVFDKEIGGYKWIDEDQKKYKLGQGVYRSSYRNAQRLARTETNIAYRTADYERWQQLDFIVGVDIKLSNNHPVVDICDDLQGRYPKYFKWTGWHPNCRCYMLPILAGKEEMDSMIDSILSGDYVGLNSKNAVKLYPTALNKWAKQNKGRIILAKQKGTLPYFYKDNKKVFEKILK